MNNIKENIDDLNQRIPKWACDALEKLMSELGMVNPIENIKTPRQIADLRCKILYIIYRGRCIIDTRQTPIDQVLEQEDARVVQILKEE